MLPPQVYPRSRASLLRAPAQPAVRDRTEFKTTHAPCASSCAAALASRALLCRYAQQPQAFDVHVIRHINPALEGEALALHLSQIITFMEYDMHSLIIAKLRCLPAHFFHNCARVVFIFLQLSRAQLRIWREYLLQLHVVTLHGTGNMHVISLSCSAPATAAAIRQQFQGGGG